jgi:hypothetical protein
VRAHPAPTPTLQRYLSTILQAAADQFPYFAGLGMPATFQLGVNQVVVNFHFEAPTIRRHQAELLNFRLKLFQQLGCQTGSPVGIVSDRAVGNRDI